MADTDPSTCPLDQKIDACIDELMRQRHGCSLEEFGAAKVRQGRRRAAGKPASAKPVGRPATTISPEVRGLLVSRVDAARASGETVKDAIFDFLVCLLLGERMLDRQLADPTADVEAIDEKDIQNACRAAARDLEKKFWAYHRLLKKVQPTNLPAQPQAIELPKE
jgi:hypothetical protein